MGSFVTDNFNGTEGDALETYQPDWTRHGSYYGYAEIAANRVRPTSTSSPCYYRTATPPSADYEVIADVYIATDSGNYIADICGRINTAAKTMYLASCYGSAGGGGWRLRKVVGGTVTQLGATVTSPLRSVGSTYRLKLKMTGDQISLYVDGSLVIGPITDTSITAVGKAGIQFYSASSPSDTVGYHLDNFDATDGVSGDVYTETLTDTAIALATLTDLAARVETLLTILQAAGSVTDAITAAESVLTALTAEISVTDSVSSAAAENVMSVAFVADLVNDAATRAEQTLTTIQSATDVAEVVTAVESLLTTFQAAGSVTDTLLSGAIEDVLTTATASATATDAQTMRETLITLAQAGASAAELGAFFDSLLATAKGQGSVTDSVIAGVHLPVIRFRVGSPKHLSLSAGRPDYLSIQILSPEFLAVSYGRPRWQSA